MVFPTIGGFGGLGWTFENFRGISGIARISILDSLFSPRTCSVQTTCRDANAHLLLDFDHDGELDLASSTGFAFHEHAGRGEFNELKGLPFTNFWFDDNSLAM